MGRIFLSAGHYLNDPGAPTAFNTSEAEEMMRTRDQIVEELLNSGWRMGENFFSVPDNLSLSSSIRWINQRAVEGDVAIEIHGNSGGGEGAEIYYIAGNQQREEDARRVLEVYLDHVYQLGISDRGAKPDTLSYHGRLGFCRNLCGQNSVGSNDFKKM
jgi:N-acetylmuramoyl-L-alanine amidase